MKKLFTLLLLLCNIAAFSQTHACTDIYFRRQIPFNQYSVETEYTWFWCEAQSWHVPDGYHKLFEIPSQCAILSMNPLIIDTNSAFGYVPDTCDNPPFQMKMPGYIQFHLYRWNGTGWILVSENRKESFQLQSTGNYPYGPDSSVWVSPAEWDYITSFGIPPVGVASLPPAPSSNAYTQMIGAGYIDTYAAGYYNNGLVIDTCTAGIYKLVAGVYPAAFICENDVFPNTEEYILQFDGDETFTETVLPTCEYNDINSPTGCTATQAWGHGGDGTISISFNEVPGIDSVAFQRWYATGNLSGQEQGPPVIVSVNAMTYDAVLHRYKYSFAPNFPAGNYRWYINAHNCAGWSSMPSATDPKLRVH